MTSKTTLILGLLALLMPASMVRAQCEVWAPGPLQDGTGPNGTDGAVYASTTWNPDPVNQVDDWLVVAGSFNVIEGVLAKNIALRDPATGTWSPLGAGIDGPVYALTAYNGSLIAAGWINAAGGQPVNRIARWHQGAWLAMGSGLEGGIVRSLHVHNGNLLAGGTFTTAGGQAAQGIASWNGSTWSPFGVQVPGLEVDAMATWGGDLFVGGGETVGVLRAIGGGWQVPGVGLPGRVVDFQAAFGLLYAAVNNGTSCYLASWNGAWWTSYVSYPSSRFEDLDYYDGAVVACGDFNNAVVTDVLRWNGSALVDLSFEGISGPVYTLIEWQDELVAGGSFSQAAQRTANNLARWNGVDWGAFGAGQTFGVNAMAVFGSRVVAGGLFHQTTGNGSAVHRLVTWDGTQMVAMGDGANKSVEALKSFKYPGIFGDYELVVGGQFTSIDGVAANRIAHWREDPTTGFPIPEWLPMGAGFDGPVYAIERFNNETYAAGSFTASTGPLNRIARWNSSSGIWEPLGSGLDGTVHALKSWGGHLYAGGAFSTAGGVPTGGLAKWDGSNWTPVVGILPGTVYSFEDFDAKLMVGGSGFGGGFGSLFGWDGAAQIPLGTGVNGSVRALRTTEPQQLYAGGFFSSAGGQTVSNVAYWDLTDSSWHDPDSGVDGLVRCITSNPSGVHIGGDFQHLVAGTVASRHWARQVAGPGPEITSQPLSAISDPGSDITFACQLAPGPAATFQWSKLDAGGVPIPLVDGPTGSGSTLSGSQTQTLLIVSASSTDEGSYRVAITSDCGTTTSSTVTLELNQPTSVPDPSTTTLFEALMPNPTGGSTQVGFSLGRSASVRMTVFDLRGRVVGNRDLGQMQAGRHLTRWDGVDGNGRRVGAGTYFVRLLVDGETVGVKRLTLVR